MTTITLQSITTHNNRAVQFNKNVALGICCHETATLTEMYLDLVNLKTGTVLDTNVMSFAGTRITSVDLRRINQTHALLSVRFGTTSVQSWLVWYDGSCQIQTQVNDFSVTGLPANPSLNEVHCCVLSETLAFVSCRIADGEVHGSSYTLDIVNNTLVKGTQAGIYTDDETSGNAAFTCIEKLTSTSCILTLWHNPSTPKLSGMVVHTISSGGFSVGSLTTLIDADTFDAGTLNNCYLGYVSTNAVNILYQTGDSPFGIRAGRISVSGTTPSYSLDTAVDNDMGENNELPAYGLSANGAGYCVYDNGTNILYISVTGGLAVGSPVNTGLGPLGQYGVGITTGLGPSIAAGDSGDGSFGKFIYTPDASADTNCAEEPIVGANRLWIYKTESGGDSWVSRGIAV